MVNEQKTRPQVKFSDNGREPTLPALQEALRAVVGRVLGQIRIDYLNASWLIFGDGFNQGTMRTTAMVMAILIAAYGTALVLKWRGEGLDIDGTLVTTTYGHWTTNQAPYIVSVRLKLAELDAAASQRSPAPVRGAGGQKYKMPVVRSTTYSPGSSISSRRL